MLVLSSGVHYFRQKLTRGLQDVTVTSFLSFVSLHTCGSSANIPKLCQIHLSINIELFLTLFYFQPHSLLNTLVIVARSPNLGSWASNGEIELNILPWWIAQNVYSLKVFRFWKHCVWHLLSKFGHMNSVAREYFTGSGFSDYESSCWRPSRWLHWYRGMRRPTAGRSCRPQSA